MRTWAEFGRFIGTWVRCTAGRQASGRTAFGAGCATVAAICLVPGTSLGRLAAEPPAGIGDPSLLPRPADEANPGLHFLLVDDTRIPHVRVSWTGEDGKEVVLEGDRRYQAPAERTPLGGNLDCFVALGGTRLDKQAGDPDGAIVRMGLYKRDPVKPLFEGLATDSPIHIVLSNIVFDKRAVVKPETGVQHIKYSPDALAECGLAGAAFELYNTVSPTDTLRGSITADNGRLGVLATGGEGGGTFLVKQEPDGSYTLRATVPYALLRHVKDPWNLTKPGTFLEPLHFHLEYEAVPAERSEPEATVVNPSENAPTLPE
jgi:hypothetical protein